MSTFRFEISMSLDGYVAGPDQSEENPLGKGGERLHDWVVELEAWRRSHGHAGGEVNESTPVVEEQLANIGAGLMGRNMFGPVGGGDWGDGSWQGWWGDDPPFHYPVFVLTHHEREPLELSDTTFNFVTDGIGSALDQAKEAAGDQDVKLSGGAVCSTPGRTPATRGSTSPPASSTSWSCTSCPSCWVVESACWMTSATWSWSRSARSRRPASPISSTASSSSHGYIQEAENLHG